MVFKKLLVAIDGSLPSAEAMRLAIALAKDQGAGVVFCHALEDVSLIEAAEAPAIDVAPAVKDATQAGRALLDAACKKAADAGVSASSVIGDDEAVHCIVSNAMKAAADLIVVGTHGRSGLEHAFLGSTAEGVLRSAHVPVLAVRPKPIKLPDPL